MCVRRLTVSAPTRLGASRAQFVVIVAVVVVSPASNIAGPSRSTYGVPLRVSVADSGAGGATRAYVRTQTITRYSARGVVSLALALASEDALVVTYVGMYVSGRFLVPARKSLTILRAISYV